MIKLLIILAFVMSVQSTQDVLLYMLVIDSWLN